MPKHAYIKNLLQREQQQEQQEEFNKLTSRIFKLTNNFKVFPKDPLRY